mmetsp:Transcript_73190/g.191854  ORF Transcript_73190/g.191854 Transcript_73190/m.191854 type:complete len:405 (+) Transcript_73190:466-1680(+)
MEELGRSLILRKLVEDLLHQRAGLDEIGQVERGQRLLVQARSALLQGPRDRLRGLPGCDFGVAPDHFADERRLDLPLHLHQVEIAADDPANGRPRRARAHDADVVVLAKAFQAAGQVDGVAHTPELHLRGAAQVAGERLARVEADADRQPRQTQGGEILVQRHERVLLRQCRRTGLRGMVLHVLRRVPESQHAVTEDLGDHAAKVLDELRHDGQIAHQHEEQVRLRQLLGDLVEVADVGEHDGDFAPRDVEPQSFLIASHNVAHDGLWHEAPEGVHALCETAKGPLQLAHVADPRALATQQLLELLGFGREVQLAQLPHVPREAAQVLRDPRAETSAKSKAAEDHDEEQGEVHKAHGLEAAPPLVLSGRHLLPDAPLGLAQRTREGAHREHEHQQPARLVVQLH